LISARDKAAADAHAIVDERALVALKALRSGEPSARLTGRQSGSIQPRLAGKSR